MRISEIVVYQLDLPLAAPYRLSGGRLLFERLDATLVRVETDEGVHGWGEVCPWGSSYLPMHGRGARAAMEELAPALLGLDPRRVVEDTGGTILADTAAAHLASTVPEHALIGTWSCQELITVDPAPGQGARVVDGTMRAPDLPGLGVEIDPDALGTPTARYVARTGSGREAGVT